MPFELTILGSSSALPTSERYPTAQVLNVSGRYFLIDCGEGTQIQIRKNKKKSVHYVYREEDKDKLLEGHAANHISIQRFKGLGEMNAAELKKTTMDPKSRMALQVTIEDAVRTNEAFETLLGREPAKRYAFIQENAVFVREIDA